MAEIGAMSRHIDETAAAVFYFSSTQGVHLRKQGYEKNFSTFKHAHF